jgi:putative hydrolase of the HAD superfamily
VHLPKRYAHAHNISEEQAKIFLDQHIHNQIGSLQWYCLDHWSKLVNMDIPALKREVLHKIQMRPFAVEFLQKLKQLGKKLVLITNAHRAGLEIKLEITEIDKYLDLVISSHDYQIPKEEAEFWLQVQAQENFNPERTLFIDDTPRILESAKRFGIHYLVCITRPDLQMPVRKSERFLDIEHFDEIMPLVS